MMAEERGESQIAKEEALARSQSSGAQLNLHLPRVSERRSAAHELDALCDMYEFALKEGGTPNLAEYLQRVPLELRAELQRELQLLEAYYAVRSLRSAGGPNATLGLNPTADRHAVSGAELSVTARELASSNGSPARFQLLQPLGSGSFASVWGAKDRQLDRLVAVKIPHADGLVSQAGRERFLREARAVAALRHPGVVTIHEVAEIHGVPVLVEEWIHGETLAAQLKQGPLAPREAARVIQAAAAALAHAHGQGIVHRDVKPGNMMRDGDRVVLLDFGLAMRVADDSNLTRHGEVLGSPAYMSPEQAQGRLHEVGPPSDVYSLGVVFHECLQGKQPHSGSATEVLRALIQERSPVIPKDAAVPAPLRRVCNGMLARNPSQRPTAVEVAVSLDAWLEHGKLPWSPARALRELTRQIPTQQLVRLLLVCSAAVLALWFALRSTNDQAAVRQGVMARQDHYKDAIKLAQVAWGQGDADGAFIRLMELSQADRAWEWHYLRQLVSPWKRHSLLAPRSENPLRLRCQAEDGSALLSDTSGNHWWFGKESAQPASAARWKPVVLPSVVNDSEHTAMSRGGTTLGIRQPDGVITVCALPENGVSKENSSLAFSALRTIQRWQLWPELLAVSGDGQWIAASFASDTERQAESAESSLTSPSSVTSGTPPTRFPAIVVWNTRTGEEHYRSEGLPGPVNSLAFCPGKAILLAGCGQRGELPKTMHEFLGGVSVFNVEQREYLALIDFEHAPILAMLPGPGDEIVIAGADFNLRVWALSSARLLRVFAGHHAPVVRMALSPDGTRIISLDQTNVLIEWDYHTGMLLHRYRLRSNSPAAVSGPQLALLPDVGTPASEDQRAFLRVVQPRQEMAQVWRPMSRHGDLVALPGKPLGVWLSPDGQRCRVALLEAGSDEDSLPQLVLAELTGLRSLERSSVTLRRLPIEGTMDAPLVTATQTTSEMSPVVNPSVTQPPAEEAEEGSTELNSVSFSPNGDWILVQLLDEQQRLLSFAADGFSGFLSELPPGPCAWEPVLEPPTLIRLKDGLHSTGYRVAVRFRLATALNQQPAFQELDRIELPATMRMVPETSGMRCLLQDLSGGLWQPADWKNHWIPVSNGHRPRTGLPLANPSSAAFPLDWRGVQPGLVPGGACSQPWGAGGTGFALAANPLGTRLAVGGEDRHVRIYSLPQMQELLALPSLTAPARFLQFSAEGALLLAIDTRGVLQVWSAATSGP